MGVHGLWPLLEQTATSFQLDHLEGKRLAIGIHAQEINLTGHPGFHGHGLGPRCPHIQMLLVRIAKLLYYKVRPVFVFDGDGVPTFKQQVKRDRRLRRHLTELTMTKSQREVFKHVAEEQRARGQPVDDEDGDGEDSASTSHPPRLGKRRSDDDLFALPEPINDPSTSVDREPEVEREEHSPVPDYLDGYDELLGSDARFNFLHEAKERAKQSRLTPDEIPQDSHVFSDFQLKRLLNRNKINTQLETLKREKVEQCVQLGDERLKFVTRDQARRTHMLVDNDEKAMKKASKEKQRILRESIPWPQFLKDGGYLDHRELTSAQKIEVKEEEVERGQPRLGPRVANYSQHGVDEDQDMQRAIFNSIVGEKLSMAEGACAEPEAPLSRILHPSGSAVPVGVPVEYMNDDAWSDSENSSGGGESQSSGDNQSDGEEEEEAEESEYYPRRRSPNAGLGEQVLPKDSRIYEDCLKLLVLLGIPYIFAPGEAEAQCVKLEQLGLVDGVISDDSDVWLFGAKLVYRNMFSRSENPEEYRLEDIRSQLGLSRRRFIQLAMLSGGDYTRGLEGVGMVAALEFLAEFSTSNNRADDDAEDVSQGLELLAAIREWLQPEGEGQHQTAELAVSVLRRRLRTAIEKHNEPRRLAQLLHVQFPNVDVYKAYAEPLVNNSEEKFEWRRVNFDKLYDFLWDKLGLTKRKVQKATNGAFDRWDAFVEQSSRQYQSRITSFFKRDYDNGVIYKPHELLPSKRAKTAVARLKDPQNPKEDAANNDEPKAHGTAMRGAATKMGTEGGGDAKRRISKRLQGKRKR